MRSRLEAVKEAVDSLAYIVAMNQDRSQDAFQQAVLAFANAVTAELMAHDTSIRRAFDAISEAGR